ncbi:MAG TPA: sugar ABC transporter permease, partial [Amycolatopsis sp.]|nr:sugar ABC transporter permease [Amycolatopsis sp.]
AFQGFDIGQSSAMGVVVVILTLIVATFALRLMFRTFDVSGRK